MEEVRCTMEEEEKSVLLHCRPPPTVGSLWGAALRTTDTAAATDLEPRSLIPDHQSTVTSRDNGARTPAAAVASQLHQLFYFLSFALGFLLFGLFLRSGDIDFILVIIEFIPLVPLSQILHASALIS